MAFSTTPPNFDEARQDALQALIVSKIADLDALVSQDSLLPAGTMTSDLVLIGDPEQMASVTETPIVISVVGGGERDGMDVEAQFEFIDLTAGRGFRYEWRTNVFVYIHKDLFPASGNSWAQVKLQTERRERLRSRINDWLLEDVFNTAAGSKIALASSVYASPNDYLIFAHARQVYKGYFNKGFGGSESLWGLHLVHVGRTI